MTSELVNNLMMSRWQRRGQRHSVGVSKLLNLSHPYPHCCLSVYFTVFRLGETAGPLLALLPLFPKYYMVLGMGIIATLPLSGDQFLLMSIESSRTHWFFWMKFWKEPSSNIFPFGKQKIFPSGKQKRSAIFMSSSSKAGDTK